MKKSKVIITIFGSTGDLATRKILPAIACLVEKGLPDKDLAIFAVGRRSFDTEKYLEFATKKNPDIKAEALKEKLAYVEMDISNKHDFLVLKNVIKDQAGPDTVFVYFLALAAELSVGVLKNLSQTEIVKKGDLKHRLVFEKPFGSSKRTSKKLNKSFWKIFDEEQIYRIDHYLGKEIVKQLPSLRFDNKHFADFTAGEVLKRLSVVALEKDGILERGEYYEKAGATRDMVQNHLLQLVALSIMEKPLFKAGKSVADQKVEVLKRLRVVDKSTVFGQYKNYFKEKNVSAFSKTETLAFFEMKSLKRKHKKLIINVLAAKKAGKKLTEIVFEYASGKRVEVSVSSGQVLFVENGKESKVVKFEEYGLPYENLILSAYDGKREDFMRHDEVDVSWKVVDKSIRKRKQLFEYDSALDIAEKVETLIGEVVFEKVKS